MRMNYDSVRRDMQKLRALGEDCETAARTCTKYETGLDQYWEGSAAEAYKEALRMLKKKNQDLARQITEAAALIQSVADELEEEDRRIAAQISRKSAGSAAKTAGAVSKASDAVSATGAAAKTVNSAATAAAAKQSAADMSDAVNDLLSKMFGQG